MKWFKTKNKHKPQKSINNYNGGYNEITKKHYIRVPKIECYADVIPDLYYYNELVFTGDTQLEAWAKACNATLYYADRVDCVPEEFRFYCEYCGTEGLVSQYQCNCRINKLNNG